jgi:AcrR family transcriptional regulator
VTPQRTGRRPGTSSSRDDILDAARELFATRGYERATLRAIGREAGVDPALIIHYFGSKEGLLRAALTLPIDPPEVIAAALAGEPPDRIGGHLVKTVIAAWDAPSTGPTLRSMFRTALSHPEASRIFRETLEGTVLAALRDAMPDDRSGLRAELIAAQMAGILMSRYVLELPQIAAMSATDVGATVGPSIQRYLSERLPE